MSSPPSTELQAAILGLVQGVCEFLPISSSAHLVVLPQLLGWPYLGKSFDVALHLGTLLALVVHFRQQIGDLWRGGQRLIFSAGKARDRDAHQVKMMVIASIPAAVAGFFLDDLIEPYLNGLLPVAVFSIMWGVGLGWADSGRWSKDMTMTRLTPLLAFWIGCAQATALLPGTSRSGVTITAALLVGLSRPQAARFSLLLSIPVVAGAAFFKGWTLDRSALTPETFRALVLGIGTSAAAGSLCLTRFLTYLEKGSFRPFVVYRILFGLGLLLWISKV